MMGSPWNAALVLADRPMTPEEGVRRDYLEGAVARSGAQQLFENLMKVQEMKRQAARDEQDRQEAQAKLDATNLANATTVANLRQTAAAKTPIAEAPQVDTGKEDVAFLNPDEAAFAGVQAPQTGTVGLGAFTTPERSNPIPFPLGVGGGKVDIPLQYQEEADAAAKRAAELTALGKQRERPTVNVTPEQAKVMGVQPGEMDMEQFRTMWPVANRPDASSKPQFVHAPGVGVFQVGPDQKLHLAIPTPTAGAGSAAPGPETILKPGQKGFSIAQDMAYGALTFPAFRSMMSYNRTIDRATLYATAKYLNHNFNPADFELGYRFAVNPKIRQQVASQDNVLAMVDHLLDVSNKAARSGVPVLNNFVVKGGIQLGDKRYSNLATARTAFADELSGALGFGSATDMSREMGFDMTRTDLGPEQFADAIQDIVVPFVRAKRQTLVNQMGIYGKNIDKMSGVGSNTGGAASSPAPAAGTDVNAFLKKHGLQ